MNLLDLLVRIGVDDQASSAIGGIGEKIKGGLGKAAKATGAAVTAAVGAAVTGAGALGAAAVSSAADFEQLWGGVQKLYGNAGQSLEEYAEATGRTVDEAEADWYRNMRAQQAMLSQAQEAYRTSGMSANEYMETATGFSASLISSLGGDTEEAARLTDVAMRAISDNVNTFGSNAEDVTHAIMGLSRQNYTMLDNLKLGYAGSAEGMLQLINDSGVLGETLTDTSQLADVGFATMIQAIQAVQEQQGIAGTTAREAASTLSGSLAMLSSAWKNLTTDIGSFKDTIFDSADAVVESISAVLDNLIPMIQNVAETVALVLPEIVPKLIEQVKRVVDTVAEMLPQVLPPLLDAVLQALTLIVEMIPTILPTLVDAVVMVIEALAGFLPTLLPVILEAAILLFMAIVEALPRIMPQLTDAIVGLIESAADFLPQLIPAILEAAITLFMAVVQAVPQITGALLGAIGDMLMQGVQSIFGATPEFSESGGGIMDGLFQGVTNGFLSVIDFIGSIPSKILGFFGDAGSWLLDAGSNIINGFLDGLKGAWGGITSFVGGIGDWIVSHKGPEDYDKKLLVNAGQLIMGGLNLGLESGIPALEKTLGSITDTIQGGVSADVSWSGKYSQAAPAGIIIKDCQFNVRDDDDIQRIADAIGRMVTRQSMGRLFA